MKKLATGAELGSPDCGLRYEALGTTVSREGPGSTQTEGWDEMKRKLRLSRKLRVQSPKPPFLWPPSVPESRKSKYSVSQLPLQLRVGM